VNNFFKKSILLLAAACLFSGGAHAQLDGVPRQNTAVFGFFNGVQDTAIDAVRSLVHLRRLYDSSGTPWEFDLMRFELFYNTTNGMENFAATFDQQLGEQLAEVQDRYELFFDRLRGGGGWWENIRNIPSLTDRATDFLNSIAEVPITGTIDSISDDPEHRQRINSHALEGHKFLLLSADPFADDPNSIGNVLLARAYGYATAVVGADAVRIIVVDPASVQLGNDLVYTTLIELASATLPAAIARFEIFTAALEWDGSGDVDLHIYEPGGRHVYYAAPLGSTGYLDVNNTQGFGPEHYFASSGMNPFQPDGIYRIAVANFAGATGRRASVQIASAADGVLGTRQTVLGEPTGAEPSVTLFRVEVRYDSTGRHQVRLVD